MTVKPDQALEDDWPELTFPELESKHVEEVYRQGKVILEFGSGGSTMLAAKMPDKLIYSVESDLIWAIKLQERLDRDGISPVYVHHVDIGRTGSYGRPLDDSNWQSFHRYATSIWMEPFFRHPDVVLIDGRLRSACFLFTCISIRKPTIILFDDYVERPKYHQIERLAKPSKIIGRMAEFNVSSPIPATPELIFLFSELCGQMTYSGRGPVSYEEE